MTKIISHRGNIHGPEGYHLGWSPVSSAPYVLYENNPIHIETVRKDFIVEVDVWKLGNKLFLGHDKPEYEVEFEFFHIGSKHGLDVLVHAKNIDALMFFKSTAIHTFWHQKDDFALTSHGFIIAYPGQYVTPHTIIMEPEKARFEDIQKAYAICTDYPYRWRDLLCK